jgi:SAM-dependent methyltransferase
VENKSELNVFSNNARTFSRGRIMVDHNIQFDDPNYYSDIKYESRENDQFSTTKRESVFYYKHLRNLLKGVPQDGLLLDAGCGDGRFTRWCLQAGQYSLISTDIDYNNLRTLEASLSEGESSRVKLLQAVLLSLPLRSDSFDAIIAIGVLNVLKERMVDVCRSLHALLKPGGIFINTEPTMDGSLLYALVRHDPDEFFKVLETKTKAIDYDGDRSMRYPVFEAGEVERALVASGFVLEEMQGIPVYPSLVFGGMLKEIDAPCALKERCADAMDAFLRRVTTVHRVVMYRSRKSV